jgi:hypothetical protein
MKTVNTTAKIATRATAHARCKNARLAEEAVAQRDVLGYAPVGA